MSSKLIHVQCDGQDEFLLITPDMSIQEVKEKLFELKGTPPTDNMYPVLSEKGCNVPLNDIEENDSESAYVLRILTLAEFNKYKKEAVAKTKVAEVKVITKKTVHVSYDGKTEALLITSKMGIEEVTEVLLTVANLDTDKSEYYSVLLTDKSGASVSIAAMPENSAESCFILKVNDLNPETLKIAERAVKEQEDNMESLLEMVSMLKTRIKELEDTDAEDAKIPVIVEKPTPPAQIIVVREQAQAKEVKKTSHFQEENKYVFTEETLNFLKTPNFDNWQWEDNEIMGLLELIFKDFGLIEEFNIEPRVLRRFLTAVKENYQENPFHNFRHCFCMFAILSITDLATKLAPIDRLILVVSCIGHDINHPGYNNAYQVNAKTDLAILYSDVSPLENHHCAMLFIILQDNAMNIFRNVPTATYREIRKGIIRCILATDMAKHGELMGAFRKLLDCFDYEDAEHKSLLCQMVIKCSDISNEVRPMTVSEPWVDCLLEEFFTQSDREKAEGLPTAPFMDREKVTKPSAQIGFIGFVMVPLFELVSKVLPEMEDAIIKPIKKSLAYYKDVQDKATAASTL